MMAGLGRFTAAGKLTQDFGPGIPAEPDNIYCQRDAVGWLRARLIAFAGATRRDDFHLGVDIAGAAGTPILAPEAGLIVAHYIDPWGAKDIILQIRPGTVIIHAHLSKYLAGVGDKVKRGETIGLMGKTGNAFGVHDHIEVRRILSGNWREWWTKGFAYDPQRLQVGGDMAGVAWITPP